MPWFSPSVNSAGIFAIDSIEDIKNLFEIIVIIIAGIWALYKIQEFRDFKHWIQFDIGANIYQLSKSITAKSYTWKENGERQDKGLKNFTHVLEILFKFNNKGKTRVKLYNIQAIVSTLPPEDNKAHLDEEEGHLSLGEPMLRTGNIVRKDVQFYYIEPQVEQIITYLTLIEKPKDIIRIRGMFCQDNRRIYPKKDKGSKYFRHDEADMYAPIEKQILPIRIYNNFSYSLCKFLRKRKVFCWSDIGRDGIQGKDDEKLKKYLLRNFYDLEFINHAKPNRVDESTIEIRGEEKLLSLKIIKSRKIIIKINNIQLDHRLMTRMEIGGLVIYERGRYDPIYGWALRLIYEIHCKRLLSHTSERTFSVDRNGYIIK